jgi:hypothetical protein
MTVAPTCPRCSGALRAPGLMSSDWACALHGPVHPYTPHRFEGLAAVTARARVPVWAPLPLLPQWTVGGLGACGDERTGATATVLALMGPSPLGGPADLLLVAEEPGIGLGARIAGIDGLDPGSGLDGAPDAKILVAGHPTPLWRTDSAEDRVSFVGEASGVWLWAVLWPPAAELVLLEHVELHDLCLETRAAADLPVGAASPRLP